MGDSRLGDASQVHSRFSKVRPDRMRHLVEIRLVGVVEEKRQAKRVDARVDPHGHAGLAALHRDNLPGRVYVEALSVQFLVQSVIRFVVSEVFSVSVLIRNLPLHQRREGGQRGEGGPAHRDRQRPERGVNL